MKTVLLFVGSIAAAVIITLLLSNYTEEPEGVTPEFLLTPDGTFNRPTDVVINGSEWIFVTDSFNGRVQLFNNVTYAFDSVIGQPGTVTNTGDLFRPGGLFVDNSTDTLFVTSTLANFINVYNSDGTFSETLGQAGSTSGTNGFSQPIGIVGNGTHLFVADSVNNRIAIILIDGTFVCEIGKNSDC